MSRILAAAALAAGLAVSAVPSHAALVYGSNVIINPGAEADVGSDGTTFVSPSGWVNSSSTNGIIAVYYGAPAGYPSATDPGPGDRGSNFFGGTIRNPFASITQLLDVSNKALSIDTGLATFTLSGWLGGYYDQNDQAQFSVTFENALGSAVIGPVTLVDRTAAFGGFQTGFLYRTISGTIPAGTRALLFTLAATRYAGTADDGYADNLSFIANGPAVSATPLPGALSLFATGIGALGLVGWRRKRKIAAARARAV